MKAVMRQAVVDAIKTGQTVRVLSMGRVACVTATGFHYWQDGDGYHMSMAHGMLARAGHERRSGRWVDRVDSLRCAASHERRLALAAGVGVP